MIEIHVYDIYIYIGSNIIQPLKKNSATYYNMVESRGH